MRKLSILAVALYALIAPAQAQNTTGLVVASCGNQTFKAGNPGPFTVDTTGKLCSSASGGSSTITANSTVTSGFSAGQFLYSDGSKVQAGTFGTGFTFSAGTLTNTPTSGQVTTALGYTPMNGANNLSEITIAATARTNLGLGTAATQNTGTSGATVPLLNGANTWSATQTFTLAPVFTDASGSRTALGLGTSATVNTGTSGATIPLLNGANTWSSAQTLTSAAPQLVLGVNTTTLGSIKMFGNTSGDATLQPAAVAGTSTVITLPAVTSTLATLGANTFTATQTITPAANTNALAVTGYSLTGANAQSLIDVAGTWNTSGVPTAIKLSITNTATGANPNFAQFFGGAAGATEYIRITAIGSVVSQNALATVQGYIGVWDTTAHAVSAAATGAEWWYQGGSGHNISSNKYIAWSNATGNTSTLDTYLTRGGAAATLQLGAADAAAPVAQKIQSQSVVAATSNTAGATFTVAGSRSTGSGLSGDLVLSTGDTGAASTTQNAHIAGLTIKGGTAASKSGSVVLGSAAISTTATDGFLYIASGAGAPTGTPTAFTGRVALYYDTTNHQFWIYDGAWLQPKTPAAAATVTWQ